MCDKVFILTDHGDSDKFLGIRVRVDSDGLKYTFVDENYFLKKIHQVLLGVLFYARSHMFKYPAVVVTYAGGLGFIFAGIQYLLSPFVTPLNHFMFDLLLDEKRKGFGGVVDSVKSFIFNRAVSGAVVWGKSDVDLYSREHGLKREKLYFHPYHITLDDMEECSWNVCDNGFVFCGGNVGRDFKTVINSLGCLGYPTVIATQVPCIKAEAEKFANIKVVNVSHKEFRQLMAQSTFIVEAHDENFFRTAGHQTMLNAMFFGKPVILLDERSAEGYVEDGVTGFVLSHGDFYGLCDKAKMLWEDELLRSDLGENCLLRARNARYGTLNHMQSIYNLAIKGYNECNNLDTDFGKINLY